MTKIPNCDCTAECGDDPRIMRGTVKKCDRWEAIHADYNDIVKENYRSQLEECISALSEIYSDFGECSRIAEICEPLISKLYTSLCRR